MSNHKYLFHVTSILGLGAALTLVEGCEQAAELCDLDCPLEGIIEGNALGADPRGADRRAVVGR